MILYYQRGFCWNAKYNVLQNYYKAAYYTCLECDTVQCGINLRMFHSGLVPPCWGRKNALDSHCCENLRLCMECPHGTYCCLVSWGQVPCFCSQCCNAFIWVCGVICISQSWLCLWFVTVVWCEFIFGSNSFSIHCVPYASCILCTVHVLTYCLNFNFCMVNCLASWIAHLSKQSKQRNSSCLSIMVLCIVKILNHWQPVRLQLSVHCSSVSLVEVREMKLFVAPKLH
jgi:hypothetical protein